VFNKLYVRIWLAVVMAVAVLTLLVGWAWRLAAEPPLRDVVVRDDAGQIIGRGQTRGPLTEEEKRERHALRRALRQDVQQMPAPPPAAPAPGTSDEVRPGEPADGSEPVHAGPAPEFVVRMHDGRTVHMHLMRAPPSMWSRPPFGFAWMLIWVGIAVALATYPIVRKLTRRLERLQDGVQQWGQGDLSTRVSEVGKDEVAFLAKRFNQAAQRVQTLVQSHEALLASQKSLLANASHELRSPLTRIRMGLELMGPSATPAFRDEISRNIKELDQLIEEILLASRLDAREADMGTVESIDLIGMAAEESARVDAEFDVQCTAAPNAQDDRGTELAVHGVAKLLRRALRNLLENANRHAAGSINLSLGQTDTLAVIRVCDRGPGVPLDLQERIFEPFYRLPGATERDGGVGLGLALVKSIAQRHGGRAYCENREGGGACFVIELPLSSEAATDRA
jgi:signal transduction histidine kinase